jgi:urate oxidase
MPTLVHNSYGKSDVRLTKVVRSGSRHELFEINASIILHGDFAAAYLEGDNRQCVATDTMKNFVYVKAKEFSFKSVEEFAIILAEEFCNTYAQVGGATVELTQACWRRIEVDGKPHDHAFVDGGRSKRYARASAARGGATQLVGGVRDLVVLKTTASEWRDFHTDRHRTLKDASDRIMATSIDADWHFANARRPDFDQDFRVITGAMTSTFATKHSLGVQQTIMDMGNAVMAACDAVSLVHFVLPNLHRIPFNLDPFGLKFENDIFVATDEPYGRITGTITRDEGEK